MYMYLIIYIPLVILFTIFCIKGNIIVVNTIGAILSVIVIIQIIYNVIYTGVNKSEATMNNRREQAINALDEAYQEEEEMLDDFLKEQNSLLDNYSN